VIRRDNGTPTFFFCNAIDDALMGVTHVLRGDDHLGNTPRQLLLLQALSLSAPHYGHVALLTGADGTPLSKRQGASTVRALREAGHAPQAICNLLFRLGHGAADNALLSLDQMAQAFDTAHLQRASAHLDPAQLRHWQSEWVRRLDLAAAVAWLQPWLPGQLDTAARDSFIRAVLPNVVIASDLAEWVQVFFTDPLQFEEQARDVVRSAGTEFFRAAATAVGDSPPELQRLREATGRKGAAFFMPLRAALTGRLHGPELGPLLSAMPVERIRARLSAQGID
jgi:glutamyl-tRNA synthetase